MNPDTSALRQYIDAQRATQVSDPAIHQALITSGWPPALVEQVLRGTETPLPSYPTAQDAQTYSNQEPAETDAYGVFKGRLSRAGLLAAYGYILCLLIPSLLIVFLGGIFLHGSAVGDTIGNVLLVLLGMAAVIVAICGSFSVHIRRWHDLGQTGWLALLGVIPVIGFVTTILLLVLPGTKEANSYGATAQRSLKLKGVFNLK